VNLPRFLAELKRRHVYRAAVAYVVVSWALVQVLPVFDIANSVIRWVIVALMLGFPIGMVFWWLYALMRRKDDAIREGRRAVELKPESVDALDGVLMNCYLAPIFARCGEKDLAFPLLERLMKTPGASDSGNYSVTVNDLKFRWDWNPIRNDPRFQKLPNTAP
jgi:hypothetical protein